MRILMAFNESASDDEFSGWRTPTTFTIGHPVTYSTTWPGTLTINSDNKSKSEHLISN